MVKKIRVLTQLRVIAEPDLGWAFAHSSLVEQERQLEEWCRDFGKFVKDHRSQDPVSLSVERTYRDQCSSCKNDWETFDDEGLTCCAYCGVAANGS